MSQGVRQTELDGLRGLAILLVLAVHVGLLPGGWVGVSLFFALSGYLITSLLLAEYDTLGRIDRRAFYWRRAARLLPALIVALPLITTYVALTRPYDLKSVLLGDLVVSVYAMNFIGAVQALPYQNWAWSLALEEQFYLLWPHVLRSALARHTSRRRLALGVAVVALLIAAARAAQAPAHPELAYTLMRGDEVLAGCLMALLRPRLPAWASWLAGGVFVAVAWRASVAGWNVPGGVAAWSVAAGAPLATVSSAVLVASAADVPLLAAALRSRVLRHFGRISYALYIWNGILISVWQGARDARFVLAAIACAEVSTRCVEEPARRWAQRRRPITSVTANPGAHEGLLA